MTVAVCFKCGHIKFGALCACDKCNTAPLSAKEKALSMVLTEFFLKGDMDEYSNLIKSGTIVWLDKKTEDMWIDSFRDKDMPSKKTDDMRINHSHNDDDECLP